MGKSNKNIRVIDWTSEADTAGMESSIGGLGGFFSRGMRWSDYIEGGSPVFIERAEAIRVSAIENGIRHTGEHHQFGDDGVPVFSDGTCGSFSFRAWGDLMAAIWSEEEGRDYSYMDFYM
jgi:hypothetical protein